MFKENLNVYYGKKQVCFSPTSWTVGLVSFQVCPALGKQSFDGLGDFFTLASPLKPRAFHSQSALSGESRHLFGYRMNNCASAGARLFSFHREGYSGAAGWSFSLVLLTTRFFIIGNV